MNNIFKEENNDPTPGETIENVIACFEVETSSDPTTNTEISFTNCSENATVYAWNFGDGGFSSSLSPTYTFNKAGNYTVKLIVGNSSSADTTSFSLVIKEEAILGRWKSNDEWNDFCETSDKPISGKEYFNFKENGAVIYELELTGDKYNCTGEVDVVGKWQQINGKYYFNEIDDEELEEITISESNVLCLFGDCYVNTQVK